MTEHKPIADVEIKSVNGLSDEFLRGLEYAASLHESVNPASDNERLAGAPGAGAMGAVIEYRDIIRSYLPKKQKQEKPKC